jgi:hypothetical protein
MIARDEINAAFAEADKIATEYEQAAKSLDLDGKHEDAAIQLELAKAVSFTAVSIVSAMHKAAAETEGRA